MQGTTYAIHDNGNRPFDVTIQGKTVRIDKNMDTYEYQEKNGTYATIHKEPKHLVTLQVDHVFVGKKSPLGGYDGLKPKDAEGNSLLLTKGAKYIYVGHEIYEFTPVQGDTIVKYYSDIGNSDVPYPYAIGTTHVYIMLDKVAIEKSFFDMKKPIYEQYYEVETHLPMCLRGAQPATICKDREEARRRIKDLATKTHKLKTKRIQKRL